MYHIKPVITLECFRIVTYSYAASFSIKTCLNKTNNIFFLTQKLRRFTEIVYKNKLKINVKSAWTFFLIMLTLIKNKDFCMKTILCNDFITTNDMALTKAVLESSYRVLPRT